ncbi:MAG TPA: glycosyltransferase family 2 protein [Anaerolineae bacterium]|nr:glycosyltransferase family 2 protein [Anaerolineae bacterium]
MSILVTIYVIAALLLALYGFNAWILTGLFFAQRRSKPPADPSLPQAKFPAITVQLPIYNEALVVERLIDAVVKLDYPASRLQIQVLDDSTDETTAIAERRVKMYRRRGVNIQLVHRAHRAGFKAGALKNGLETATGTLIAIFDADFVPDPNFLKQTVSYFAANPQLGLLQTRWGHLNRSYSWLTLAQGLALDGHFAVEQVARNRGGLLINFNGTAGLWRRACIEAAGGWQGDTISEDFDLSYRAQLAGWQCLFLPDVVAPAEIPPQLAAFKRQQFRWAKGSIQCLKKLGWSVLRSDLSWWVKFQAIIHLSSYLAHPLMVVLALVTPLLMLGEGTDNVRFPLIYLSLISLGPPFLYLVAQISLYPRQWRRHYRAMPLLILLGSGVALSNTKAVIEAVLGIGHVFRRTPKFNVRTATERWQESPYRLPVDSLVVGELALALYSLLGAVIAALNGHQFAVPFILLYTLGFGYVGLLGVWEARRELRRWLAIPSFRSRPTTARSRSPRRRKPVSVER